MNQGDVHPQPTVDGLDQSGVRGGVSLGVTGSFWRQLAL